VAGELNRRLGEIKDPATYERRRNRLLKRYGCKYLRTMRQRVPPEVRQLLLLQGVPSSWHRSFSAVVLAMGCVGSVSRGQHAWAGGMASAPTVAAMM
jgi:hypothetical protein